MRLERAYLLSLYLMLVLACACMSYAVQPYLPELAYLTCLVMGLLVISFWLEGRWALSNVAANLLAVMIAAAAGLWVAYRLVEPPKGRVDLAILSAPMLPHLGALLIVLMVVKLFRPKQIGDYWWLHAIGFMAVALACVLDSDALFGILFCGYLACTIWSLSLFHLHRGQLRNAAREPIAVPWPMLGLRLTARRALLMAVTGLFLFLVTPRLVSTPWPPNPFRIQTGLAETGIDLNRTGTIQLNTEVAFEVEARDAQGKPKLDLDPDLRFRGMSLNSYRRGTWFYRANISAEKARPDRPAAAGLADLGPDQFFLTYSYTYQPRHRLVLAEPIVQPADPTRVVVVSLGENGEQLPWLRQPTGEYLPPRLPRRYLQVTQPESEEQRPPADLEENQIELFYRLPPLPGLQEWTTGVLQRLAEQGRLAGTNLQPLADGKLPPESHEAVGRVLTAYLANSGEYTYSLELPRHDPEIDPVLDFLWNAKRGHCQRFASALAVMLRSQGIPCRIVIGFRGVESLGDGNYAVRHSQAHAWVEALVPRLGPAGAPAHYWLTLDPTPAGALTDSSSALAHFWHSMTTSGESFWRNYVLDYHADRQAATLELWDLAASIRIGGVLLLLGIAAVMFWAIRRQWRRRSVVAPALSTDPLYAQLLNVLARRCKLAPRPAQTPLEFADQAGQHLQGVSLSPPFIELPALIAQLHYRYRYGGESISEPERATAFHRIDELDRLLTRPVANGKSAG